VRPVWPQAYPSRIRWLSGHQAAAVIFARGSRRARFEHAPVGHIIPPGTMDLEECLRQEEQPTASALKSSKWVLIGRGSRGEVWRHAQSDYVWKRSRADSDPDGADSELLVEALWARRFRAGAPAVLGSVVPNIAFIDDTRWLAVRYAGSPIGDGDYPYEDAMVSPGDAPQLARDMVAAVEHLARCGLAYVDMHPGNVMRGAPGAPFVLIDFGVTQVTAAPKPVSPWWDHHRHPAYAAATQMDGEKMIGNSLWRAGLLALWCLLCGDEPSEAVKRIRAQNNPRASWLCAREDALGAIGVPVSYEQARSGCLPGELEALAATELVWRLLSDNPRSASSAPHTAGASGCAWWANCEALDGDRRVQFLSRGSDLCNYKPSVEDMVMRIVSICMADNVRAREYAISDPIGLGDAIYRFTIDVCSSYRASIENPEIPEAGWKMLDEIGLPPLSLLFEGRDVDECKKCAARVIALLIDADTANALYRQLEAGIRFELPEVNAEA
jgi:hypothetical protein